MPWMNVALDADKRAELVVAQMTRASLVLSMRESSSANSRDLPIPGSAVTSTLRTTRSVVTDASRRSHAWKTACSMNQQCYTRQLMQFSLDAQKSIKRSPRKRACRVGEVVLERSRD